MDTYSDDNTMPLYCFLCENPCFYCGRRHNIGDDKIKIHVYTKCDKPWCYSLPKCKKDIIVNFCEDCGKKDASSKNLDIPSPSLSPTTTQCNPAIASKLHNILPSLLKLGYVEKCSTMNGNMF